jgi:urea transport system ATP-binding protein
MLELSDLTLHYGQSQILNGVSLTADTGKVTCVMGTNGVGKTSLLKAISGTKHRSGGALRLDGETIGRPPAHVLAAKGIGYVPQGRDIFPLLTVTENLETGFACLPRGERRIPPHIYDLFPVLMDMRSRRGGDLSGGQQQQLAIGRALITRPKLLLLDEPTEGIQPNIIQQIGRVIALLRDEGKMAIVLVEQYFEFAYGLADRFTVLKRGSVVASGARDSLSKDELKAAVSV